MDSFNTAYSKLYQLYDIVVPQDLFEEIGLIAWGMIGNRLMKLYRYRAKIDSETLTVDLPCNCTEIEAVTYDFEDWKYTSNDTINGDYQSQFIENYIESRKLYTNPFYTSGKFAKYEQIDLTLYFELDYGYVNILYKGIVVDDEGLPYISEKEALAIACFIAYTTKFKEGMRNHSLIILLEAQLLEQRWNRLCDAARVSKINQNKFNEILDVKTNWNRKVFNKSYKFVK